MNTVAIERPSIALDVTFNGENVPLDQLLKRLYDLEIISVLVEGGGEVLGSFLDEKLVDKVYTFIAPILIGGREAKTIGLSILVFIAPCHRTLGNKTL